MPQFSQPTRLTCRPLPHSGRVARAIVGVRTQSGIRIVIRMMKLSFRLRRICHRQWNPKESLNRMEGRFLMRFLVGRFPEPEAPSYKDQTHDKVGDYQIKRESGPDFGNRAIAMYVIEMMNHQGQGQGSKTGKTLIAWRSCTSIQFARACKAGPHFYECVIRCLSRKWWVYHVLAVSVPF